MNVDGTGVTRLTNDSATDSAPNWSPDGSKIAFETNRDGNFEVYVMNADGSGLLNLTSNSASDRQPSWSPDGTQIAFQSNRDGNFEIYKMDADGGWPTRLTNSPGADVNPDWAAINPHVGYARPRGATPLRASLVPAFRQCTAPNETHGAPLTAPSCNEINPATNNIYAPQTSTHLTVGAPDSNGAAANSVSSVLLRVMPGVPTTSTDEADVKLTVSASDIRCYLNSSESFCGELNTSGGNDYAGSLEGRLLLRITDKQNPASPDGLGFGTVQDASISYELPCSETLNTSVGSLCLLDTTLDSLVPGIVAESARAIWELGAVQVYDGGGDGDGSTANDNGLLLDQGVFVP
jgi:hypothetical protein